MYLNTKQNTGIMIYEFWQHSHSTKFDKRKIETKIFKTFLNENLKNPNMKNDQSQILITKILTQDFI